MDSIKNAAFCLSSAPFRAVWVVSPSFFGAIIPSNPFKSHFFQFSAGSEWYTLSGPGIRVKCRT
jgi:hypothetical protein